MEEEYNWKAILIGAIPVSIVMAILYYSNIARGVINVYLIIGILIAMGITYYFDKKKHNIFTSAFVVLIVALIVYGLKIYGLL
jgi:carbon starvation protein CstA|tara:strand:+ start:25653 stop:25901 length:249 start_codon:yes stop_codon:yes gene_type:complete